jgi:TonB family protein
MAQGTFRAGQAMTIAAAVTMGTRQGWSDWPGPRVLAGAATLHAVLIAALIFDWRHPDPLSAPEAMQVQLIPAPAPATAPPLAPDPPPPAEARIEQTVTEARSPILPSDQGRSSERAQANSTESVPAPAAPSPREAEPTRRFGAAQPPGQTKPKPVADLLRPMPKPPADPRTEHAAARSTPPIGRRQEPLISQDPAAGALADGDALYRVAVETDGRIDAVALVRSSGSPAFDQAGEKMIRTTMNFPLTADGGAATAFFSVTLHFVPEQ